MTQLIPANLPLFYQCLCIPAEWYEEKGFLVVPGRPKRSMDERIRIPRRTTSEFDPWEKRNEFFTLKQDDTPRLVKFLRTVGLFERPGFDITNYPGMVGRAGASIRNEESPRLVYHTSRMPTTYVWGLRRILRECLIEKADVGDDVGFDVRLERANGTTQAIITTLTFMDAMMLTLAVDVVKAANVVKCARPDCAIPFTQTSGHDKKFHCWNCGHVESVRRQRQRAKAVKTKALHQKQKRRN